MSSSETIEAPIPAPTSAASLQRWRLAALTLSAFAAIGVASGFDWRQAAVLTLAGGLCGLVLSMFGLGGRRAALVGFGLVLGLVAGSDLGDLRDVMEDYGIGLAVALTLVALGFAATRRWIFSVMVAVFLLGTLVTVSALKIAYVDAPLTWHDLLIAARSLELFLEMKTELGLAALAALTTFVILLVLWRHEPPVAFRRARLWPPTALSGAAFFVMQPATLPDHHALLRATFDSKKISLRTVDPVAYFLGSFWNVPPLAEPLDAAASAGVCCFRAAREAERLDSMPASLPNIVVVLLESTFDPALVGYPRGGAGTFIAAAHPLRVHTAGGWTWVAEYGLLHGVKPPLYGPSYHSINLLGPGRLEGRLPFILRSAGYRTTTVYPVPGHFYGARNFHHSLGMETFVECGDIPACRNEGAWHNRSDSIFLDKALALTRDAVAPQFVFLPTIQQHSPHTGEGSGAGGGVPCATSGLQCAVMQEYGRRLDASVRDMNAFQESLKRIERDTIVLAFGDHIPADVNRLFRESEFTAGRRQTFFTVWHSRRGYLTAEIVERAGRPAVVDVAFLDWVIAAAAGLESDYFRQKEAMIRRCRGEYCLSAVGAASS